MAEIEELRFTMFHIEGRKNYLTDQGSRNPMVMIGVMGLLGMVIVLKKLELLKYLHMELQPHLKMQKSVMMSA